MTNTRIIKEYIGEIIISSNSSVYTHSQTKCRTPYHGNCVDFTISTNLYVFLVNHQLFETPTDRLKLPPNLSNDRYGVNSLTSVTYINNFEN